MPLLAGDGMTLGWGDGDGKPGAGELLQWKLKKNDTSHDSPMAWGNKPLIMTTGGELEDVIHGKTRDRGTVTMKIKLHDVGQYGSPVAHKKTLMTTDRK